MDDDLDALLDDLNILMTTPSTQRQNKVLRTKNTGLFWKCIPPCLGPTTSDDSLRPCSSLKCIRCDFAVLAFSNSEWMTKTDYIFLRTNMPSEWKLRQQLVTVPGSIAYCCQCSHYSCKKLTSVKLIPEVVHWICMGHGEDGSFSD